MELKDDEVLQRVGGQLKKLRERKGWTLRDLADYSGIDNSRLSKIEQGKINITLLTLIELSTVLGASPARLLAKI